MGSAACLWDMGDLHNLLQLQDVWIQLHVLSLSFLQPPSQLILAGALLPPARPTSFLISPTSKEVHRSCFCCISMTCSNTCSKFHIFSFLSCKTKDLHISSEFPFLCGLSAMAENKLFKCFSLKELNKQTHGLISVWNFRD